MSWNHRVMRHRDKSGLDAPDYLQIHEVYYKDGKIWGWTEGAANVGGDSIEEMKQTLQWMEKCLEHPILDFDMEPETDSDFEVSDLEDNGEG